MVEGRRTPYDLCEEEQVRSLVQSARSTFVRIHIETIFVLC